MWHTWVSHVRCVVFWYRYWGTVTVPGFHYERAKGDARVTHMNDYAHEWLVCGTYFMCQTTCDSFVCVTWLDRGRLALMNESRETNEWVMWRAWMTHMWHILHRYARHASFVAQINESCDADEWLVCGTYLMWPIEWCDTDEWVTSNVTQKWMSHVCCVVLSCRH